VTVRRRDDGRWRVDVVGWQGGERVRLRGAARTKEEGIRKEAELRSKLQQGLVVTTKVPTFREWAKEFLDVYPAVNNKPSEAQTKRTLVRLHLAPFFGDTRIDRITESEIERYKAGRIEAGSAPKSINNHLTVLRRMLVVAMKWRRMSGPAPDIGFMKVPEPPFRFLTFDEARALLAAVDAEWRPMVLVALRTGLRIGELLALRWEDVDLSKGLLVVRRNVYRGKLGTPKGGRAREVAMSPEAVAALRPLPSRFAKGYVFGAGAAPLTAGETKWPLWRAGTNAKLGRLGWHVLRHTFASHLVMRGVSLKAVQELLGHRDIKMTLRYAHLAPGVKRDAVTTLDEPMLDKSSQDPIGSRLG
jgi:integrase